MCFRSRLMCVTAVAALMVLAGCATQRPVLYPNAKYKQAGPEVAKKDIDDCINMAESQGIHAGGGDRVGRGAATGAIVGGAVGAGVGAVRGDVGGRAAAGAAGGAAGGAASGAVRSGEPDSVYKGFVQRCLREKGYDVIGWK